jgi:hypothetical protein
MAICRRAVPAVCAVTATAVCAALAGCSSPSPLQKQAKAEKTAVLAEARRLTSQLVAARADWAGELVGDYTNCGYSDTIAPDRGAPHLIQYDVTEVMHPFSPATSAAAFRTDTVRAAAAAGWRLRAVHHSDELFAGFVSRRGGFDTQWVESVWPAEALDMDLDTTGACFNAGSDVSKYLAVSKQDVITLPRPRGVS